MVITSEVVDVAEAHDIVLEPVGGTLDIYRLYLPPERRTGGFELGILARHALLLAVGLKFRRLKSSMLQSIERGRRSEIDYMNGFVAERGKEKGVPTPVNAAITALVKEVEAGIRPMGPDNLADLLS
jgi:2-dehydropantoate 2-reductase